MRPGQWVCGGKTYSMRDCRFPTVDPADPARFSPEEEAVLHDLTQGFRESEKLQRHVQFLYAQGAVYACCNGSLLYHGAVPMEKDGSFAEETFEGTRYHGKALFDYCDRRARDGYFAQEGSEQRQAGQDFLWYLWCGPLSPLYGRGAMTTFERIYIDDSETHKEVKNPYYDCIADPSAAEKILAEFGLNSESSHIINGHVPVKAAKGENPVKAGGRLIVIDGGFCRAYHQKTGIAGYTLVFNSRGLTLRTHQPFESTEKAIHEDEDILSRSEQIYAAPRRVLMADTDAGQEKAALIDDLRQLIAAFRSGAIQEDVE